MTLRLPEVRTRLAWIAIVAGVLVVEAWAVMIDRDGTFKIEGERPRVMREFGEGQSVRQAFLMQGAGLHQVRVMISSPRQQEFPVDWTLWRGLPDEPATFTPAFQSKQTLSLRPGRHWVTLSFPRDSLSNDRWYTIEITAASRDASLSTSEPVAMFATHDNPERGGALWLNNVRQPGSLNIRADRQGRTLYRRFEVEALPHLPRVFANPVVQGVVVIAFHWAFWTVSFALLKDGWFKARDAR